MKIIVNSLYYDSNSTGIAKYTGEMVEWFIENGDELIVICGVTHYPQWKSESNRYSKYRQGRLTVYRIPLWIPKKINAVSRILYELSYVVFSLPIWLREIFKSNPDVLISIHPSMPSLVPAILYSKIKKNLSIVHVQDLQADAAEKLKIINIAAISQFLIKTESRLLKSFDIVSTITPSMKEKLATKGIAIRKLMLFENWSSIQSIEQIELTQNFKIDNKIPTDKLIVLYSGNLGDKQGLEIILEAARILDKEEIFFVICGDGGIKDKLLKISDDMKLNNIIFIPTQESKDLPVLLSAGDIHLIVQKYSAADLVMPSKLTNIYSSGRASIITAEKKTMLYSVVEESGGSIVCQPENAVDLAEAIFNLSKNDKLRHEIGENAKKYSMENFGKEKILGDFRRKIMSLINQRGE